MQEIIAIHTDKSTGLYDITEKVREIAGRSGIQTGFVNVYVQGATAAIMIQENWDESVQHDMLNLLRKIIPPGIWQHDHQDNNGDAHLKAGLIGPSESIPITGHKLGLSTWQNIFLCEFDGPRDTRKVVVTLFDSDR